MLKIDGQAIQLTKGDDVRLRLRIVGREVAQGTTARFTVKKRAWPRQAREICKEIPVLDGVVNVLLGAAETQALAPGAYVWDVRLTEPTEDGEMSFTPMAYAGLRVLEAIDDGEEGAMLGV